MNGAFEGIDSEVFLVRLVKEIRGLPFGKVLTIAEFASGHVAVWEVRTDQGGTPRVRYWTESWTSLCDEEGTLSRRKLLEFTQPEDPTRMLLTRSGAGGRYDGQALEFAGATYGAAPAFRCTDSVDDMLDKAITRIPLPQWYELVVLRQTAAGRLVPTGQLLFAPEARRGDLPREFRIRCEPADEHGIVFAVMARDDDDDPPEYRLVSLESARIPAGIYEVTATLLGPGRVRFDGLPEQLRPDHRNWLEVVATVPERLIRFGPAHLVLAIELCGPTGAFGQRIDCAERLVQCVATDAEGPVNYSVIGYAAHSFYGRVEEDEPVQVLAWADSGQAALSALGRLSRRGASTGGNPHAAKLECALDQITRRLSEEDTSQGRPVVVTLGSRSPYPPRLDLISEILPCPQKKDWRRAFGRLRDNHSGTAFGAIHDGPADLDIWKSLGSHARGHPDAVDMRQFAVELGLLSSTAQYVPFPLTEAGGR